VPIREYKCKDCGKVFENIETDAQDGSIKCPDCRSKHLAKLISLFSRSKPTGSSCDTTRSFG
jgi:putative FmdB family regulatory protein